MPFEEADADEVGADAAGEGGVGEGVGTAEDVAEIDGTVAALDGADADTDTDSRPK